MWRRWAARSCSSTLVGELTSLAISARTTRLSTTYPTWLQMGGIRLLCNRSRLEAVRYLHISTFDHPPCEPLHIFLIIQKPLLQANTTLLCLLCISRFWLLKAPMSPHQTGFNSSPNRIPARRRSDGGLLIKHRQQQREALELEQMRKHLVDRETLADSVRVYKENALRPECKRAVSSSFQTRNSSPSSDFWSVVGNNDSQKQ